MKKLLTLAAILATFAAAVAHASNTNVQIDGLSEGAMVGTDQVEIIASLEKLGATIIEVEEEDGEIEVEFTLDGATYEVEVDLSNGQVAELELENEDEDNDENDADDDNDDDKG